MSSSILAVALNQKSQIQEVHTIPEVQEALSRVGEEAVIFIDVDDTLITPRSKCFRASSPYRHLIDELKKNKDKVDNYETILSRWRLQRKTRLVSDEWPEYIANLKQATPVYALTKMDTGALGDIPSMEKWRHEELTAHGIVFTSTFKGKNEEILITEADSSSSSAVFHKGIFLTGSFRKSDVLRSYLMETKPAHIVLIDDRLEHLQEVMEECQQHNLPFLGILFKGTELIPGDPVPAIAAFQKKHLFEQAQWLEDEEAEIRWKLFKKDEDEKPKKTETEKLHNNPTD